VRGKKMRKKRKRRRRKRWKKRRLCEYYLHFLQGNFF
jgi:hypothetical protein